MKTWKVNKHKYCYWRSPHIFPFLPTLESDDAANVDSETKPRSAVLSDPTCGLHHIMRIASSL